jgi:hypothetical protein
MEMKKYTIFILMITVMFGCTTPKYVNVNRKHNYYQKHRYNTYTSPTWIPGRGVILETHIYRKHKPTRPKH